jgi:hypothetical protein
MIEQIQQLKKQIESTEDFIERMELTSELESLELQAGLRQQSKPIEYGEGCGDMCGA